MKWGHGAVVGAAVGLAVMGISVISQNSSGLTQEACDISVRLTPGQLQAPVTPALSAAVQFAGSIAVTKNETLTGRVNVTAHSYTAWTATLSPSTFAVGLGGQVFFNFTATVIVPAGTPDYALDQLTVTALLDMGENPCPYGQAQAQALAGAAPWFGPMTLTPSSNEISLAPQQETASVSFEVTQVHTFNASIGRFHADALVGIVRVEGPPGFSHDAPERITFIQLNNHTVRASFAVNLSFQSVVPGDHSVVFFVRSNAQDVSFEGNATVTVHIPGSFVTMQLFAGLLVGCAAIAAFGVWMWRERSKPPLDQ